MEEDNSDDWLPPGWRMEVRLRKFGRKDKHYNAPSGQKFFSKLEVLRHLKKNLTTYTPQSEEGKDRRVGSTQFKENKEVSLHQISVDACNNRDSCSPTSVEKGKTSPEISTYFSCNSMDSGSFASGEDNQVIEQNVDIHYGDPPNISCLLPEDGNTDIDAAATVITGESPAKKLENEENGILYPYTENNCSQNLEEESALKEAPTVGRNQSSVGETGRAQQSSSPITSQKRNSRHQNNARTKVVVEKCVAEGLPEGWIKEIKITKKNGNVRRDPYYTDPVSGYVFRSMKDVLRYLKTGDIGRLAFKPKDKSSSNVDVELEDEETPVRELESPLTKKPKLAETCSSDIEEAMDDLPESSHMEELSVPEYAQHESKECSCKLSEAVRLDHTEERNDCSRKDIFSVPEAKVISEEFLRKKRLRGECDELGACPSEVTQFELSREEGKRKYCKPSPQTVTQIKDIPAERFPSVEESRDATPTSSVKEISKDATRKPRKIKEISMPRRTSSRLAGIAVDPTVEIPSRASRGNGKHIGQEGPSQVKPEIQSTEVLGVTVDSYCIANDNDTPDRKSALIGVATRDVENGNMEKEMAEKRVLPFELSSPEILQDPCIEFAIKTLIGMIDFDNLDHAFQPINGMNPKSGDCSSANSKTEKNGNQEQGVGARMFPKKPSLPEESTVKPITEETAADIPSSSGDCSSANSKTEKNGNQEQGVGARMFPKKPSLPEESTVKPITEETAADIPSSSSLGGSWSDPCIEFAIKTLTGAIPVDYGVGVQDIFRQEMGASQIPVSNESVLTGVGADSICRTDSLWQHNNATAENPMYMDRDGLMPSGESGPVKVGRKAPLNRR